MKAFLLTLLQMSLFLAPLYGFADSIYVPISAGELIDKITILEIKAENIQDPAKLNNIYRELTLFESIFKSRQELQCKTICGLRKEMKVINQVLWAIEDLIREEERSARYVKESSEEGTCFGEAFVLLARLVYFVNDERGAIKRCINEYVQSDIREEKEYSSYQP